MDKGRYLLHPYTEVAIRRSGAIGGLCPGGQATPTTGSARTDLLQLHTELVSARTDLLQLHKELVSARAVDKDRYLLHPYTEMVLAFGQHR